MVLRVSDLSVRLDGSRIFAPVSFTLSRGETLMILGPNGAGKTVLLRALLGLIPRQDIASGTVAWSPGTRLGYVPQRVPLNQELPVTVEDFFSLKRTLRAPAKEVLRELGVGGTEFLRKPIGTLSSGQFQRVLIAWALAGDPDALLFDEPTAGIDVEGTETVLALLRRARKEHRLATILVTHDQNVAMSDADQVLCLSGGTPAFGPPREVFGRNHA